MKTFLKKLVVAFMVALSVATVGGIAKSEAVYANDNQMGSEARCSQLFLGMKPWDCDIQDWSESTIGENIKTIAWNIFDDMLVIATYLAMGFAVYGGYLYMFSSGDVAKVQNGKKTLTRAFIGVAIVGLARIIVDAMYVVFMGSTGSFDGMDCATVDCTHNNGASVLMNALRWFIGTGSFVALIYIVVGGVGYLTSGGDPGKLQKAKNTILYALIGLIITGLSQVIVTFAFNIVNTAEATGDFRSSLVEILNGVLSILAVVAVIVIVVGGARYMTSTGDAAKLKKARDTILYAAIGLVICGLAAVIVNFVVDAIVAGNSAEEALLELPKRILG